jgi:hypothetical protein
VKSPLLFEPQGFDRGRKSRDSLLRIRKTPAVEFLNIIVEERIGERIPHAEKLQVAL